MIRTITITAAVLAALAGCQSSNKSSSAADAVVVDSASEATQAMLLGRVKQLAGEWEMKDEQGQTSRITYAVSSNGSVVREVMFPGTDHEMTNMYHMDGAELVMTHYCAGANQPRMRAGAADATANAIALHFDNVTDLNPSEPYYMGSMTLVFHSPEKLEQRWTSFKREGGEAGNMSFVLTRVK